MIKKLFIINAILSMPTWLLSSQQQAPQQASSDYGFLWRDGAEKQRPHEHLTHEKLKRVAFLNLPPDTILTAETNDLRDPNQQESRIAFIQQNGAEWCLDFAIIQPTTETYPSKKLAQEHALAFLLQSSQERKQQEREDTAKRKQAKRLRMKKDKYRLS